MPVSHQNVSELISFHNVKDSGWRNTLRRSLVGSICYNIVESKDLTPLHGANLHVIFDNYNLFCFGWWVENRWFLTAYIQELSHLQIIDLFLSVFCLIAFVFPYDLKHARFHHKDMCGHKLLSEHGMVYMVMFFLEGHHDPSDFIVHMPPEKRYL